MAAAVLLLARLRDRSPLLRTAHAFAPVPIVAVLINVIGPVIERANPNRWDDVLRAVDARLFGPVVDAWMNAGGRPDWLTDLASLAYASYYILPVATAAVLWAKGRVEDFDALVFALAAALLASYAGYFVAPASGPRVPPELMQARLGGGAISAALRVFLAACERNQLDAFPSGHTAVSVTFLAESWRLLPRTRSAFALAVAAIIFSTVYLSLHYVIDVVAGAAVAAALLAALPWLRARFGLPAAARLSRVEA
jgi:membrane-associated phospholipid phosphatase